MIVLKKSERFDVKKFPFPPKADQLGNTSRDRLL